MNCLGPPTPNPSASASRGPVHEARGRVPRSRVRETRCATKGGRNSLRHNFLIALRAGTHTTLPNPALKPSVNDFHVLLILILALFFRDDLARGVILDLHRLRLFHPIDGEN